MLSLGMGQGQVGDLKLHPYSEFSKQEFLRRSVCKLSSSFDLGTVAKIL